MLLNAWLNACGRAEPDLRPAPGVLGVCSSGADLSSDPRITCVCDRMRPNVISALAQSPGL